MELEFIENYETDTVNLGKHEIYGNQGIFDLVLVRAGAS